MNEHPEKINFWDAINKVSEDAQACLYDDAPRIAGRDQCFFCSGKTQEPLCPEYAASQQETRATTDAMFVPLEQMQGDSTGMTDEEVSTELRKFEAIKAYMARIEKLAYKRLSDGKRIPGYKLVKGKRSRHYIPNEDESKVEMNQRIMTRIAGFTRYDEESDKRKALGLDVAGPRQLLTPAQAMKIVGLSDKQKANLTKLWEWKDGGLTMVPESDERQDAMPAVNMPDLTKEEQLDFRVTGEGPTTLTQMSFLGDEPEAEQLQTSPLSFL